MNSKQISAVRPCSNFNAIDEAYSLQDAIQTFDSLRLINILCHRTNNQRQLIRYHYKKEFDRCLIAEIKSKASGNFNHILTALLTTPQDYHVKILHKALSGPIIDIDAIIEFLCGYRNIEIDKIVQSYRQKYKKCLEGSINSSTSGHLKLILLSVIEGREEDCLVDYELAQREAALLLQGAIFNPEKQIFTTVLCRRSYSQIRVTSKEYEKITKHSLDYAIKQQPFSGPVKDAFRAMLSVARNRSEYFATKLHKSMVGLGTNDKQLIRLMVSRSEIDLLSIKNVFEQKYGKSLKSWIKGDTSGDYRDCLLALIHDEH